MLAQVKPPMLTLTSSGPEEGCRAGDLQQYVLGEGDCRVALESALADCNAALAKAPDMAGYLDSRGLVLLRLGRIDDAIADYDQALAKSPNTPSALFGRAIAWARKGDRAKAESDAAAAAKVDPDIRAEFERYGVKL
jgi:tetratricopeptide (TPR) repeat protein